MKRIFCLLTTALLIPGFLVFSRSLWNERDLFTNRKQIKIGDIIKIRFEYKNLIRYRNQTKTGTSRQVNIGRPNIKTFSFLPAFDLSMTGKDDNAVDYTTEKEFNTRIAVQVTEVRANGTLRFQGQHSIIINGQTENVTILGLVSADDLRDGNSVLSQDIADLQFSYMGPRAEQRTVLRPADFVYAATNAGVTNAGATNGRPASAELPTLSQAARRRLILDYLNRVASLLFTR